MSQDIRWEQRLENYNKALSQLAFAVKLSHSRSLSDLEKQGLIQSFEFTYELSWNLMRDYFIHLGVNSINGPRDAIREAFQKGLISQGEEWMDMLKSRNQTSHTYNQKIAEEIVGKVCASYFTLFEKFSHTMTGLVKK